MLTISNVGKAFRSYRSEWQRVLSWFGARVKPSAEHWVLREVSFSVAPGEAVGIVGQNGAGKSTLLKLIAGTLRPTEGEIHVNGRIAAILELGTGFNPEFSGRQNVLHAAGLMGISRSDIQRAMPEIATFADIGEYFEQPVRTYSSGMLVRVAFAVATAFRPEVLIIDEALAVGDAAFQRKCFQRIETFRAAGTTLLFVSHDLETVKKFCSCALFIKNGRQQSFGAAKRVCEEYEQSLFTKVPRPNSPQLEVFHPTDFDPTLMTTSCEVVYGNGAADIEACWLENRQGERINVAEGGQALVWCYIVKFNETTDDPVFAMLLKTREGVALYGVDSRQLGWPRRTYKRGESISVRFELSNYLAPGVYYLNCGVRINHANGAEFLSRRIDAAIVRITQSRSSTVVVGLLEMEARLTMASSPNVQ